MRYLRLGGIALALIVAAVSVRFAVAQDDESSRFVRFVERQISTPDRQIRLRGLEGALSSDVRIGEITIADRGGVWLRIENAQLVWSRLALLRGRLSIESLRAEAIRIRRTPLSTQSDAPLDADAEGGFQLPELPVALRIDALNVEDVEIAEGVIGPAARLSVEGSARLDSGELDLALDIARLDQPGRLDLDAAYSQSDETLAVDVVLTEPPGGVVANGLQMEGRPAIRFEIKGDGQLSNFTANLDFAADDTALLNGTLGLTQPDEGLRVVADLNGNLEPLVATLYDPLVAGGTALKLDMTRAATGAIEITQGAFRSGAASLNVSASLAPDGVPTALSL
ncbi:MAG: translocation/assembly module TamB, partial [Pseudomonadota bacterium]